jgi:hypothetical protein
MKILKFLLKINKTRMKVKKLMMKIIKSIKDKKFTNLNRNLYIFNFLNKMMKNKL